VFLHSHRAKDLLLIAARVRDLLLSASCLDAKTLHKTDEFARRFLETMPHA